LVRKTLGKSDKRTLGLNSKKKAVKEALFEIWGEKVKRGWFPESTISEVAPPPSKVITKIEGITVLRHAP